MVRKGVISSVDLGKKKARVTFPLCDGVVSADLPFADHVAPEVNDSAVVAIFSGSLADGVIIAVHKEG